MLKIRPKIVIVGGANWLGDNLIDKIISNDGEVILVDCLNDHTKYYIEKSFKKYKDSFSFFEKSKFDINQLRKISYILNIQEDINIDKYEVSSRKFISETAFMDKILSFAVDFKCRFLHVSTIKNHKKYLSNEYKHKDVNYTYGAFELQHYLELLVLEYVQKTFLDASILRIADVIGPGMELSLGSDNLLSSFFKDALTENFITIKGDGLKVQNFVYIEDAVNGILRTLFTENISGKKFSLMHLESPTLLSIASKILEFPGVKAKNIKFIESDEHADVDDLYLYLPDPNIVQIGWEPKTSVDKALYMTFQYYQSNYKDILTLDLVNNKRHSFLNHPNQEFVENTNVNSPSNGNFEIQILLDDTLKHQKIVEESYKYFNVNAQDNVVILNKEAKKDILDVNINSSSFLKKNNFKWNKNITFVIGFIFLFLIFWSVIFPMLRVISFVTSIDNNLNQLVTNMPLYSQDLEKPDLLESFHRELYFVEISLYLSGNIEQLNNIKSGLSGIERTYLVYDRFREYKNEGLFNNPQNLNEETVFKLKMLETESKVALDEIKYLQRVALLPISTREKVEQIIKLLEKDINQIDNYKKMTTYNQI